jgi:hypothetical protein
MITVSPCSGPDEIPCMDEEARCFNNVTERCNGEMDCMSGSDEKDCVRCGPGEYACHSGEDAISFIKSVITKQIVVITLMKWHVVSW